MNTTEPSTASCLRHCVCEQGLLSRPDGSARLVQGNTAVIAAVYGPAEVRAAKELSRRATLEVTLKPKSGAPVCSDHALEQVIRESFEPCILTALHPRSVISITVQVEHDDGSLLSCILNAACLALMDAGVAMRWPLATVACAIRPDEDTVLDPCSEEEKNSSAVVTVAVSGTNKKIVTIHSTGVYSIDQFCLCLERVQSAAQSVLEFFRLSTERKLSKEAKYASILQSHQIAA